MLLNQRFKTRPIQNHKLFVCAPYGAWYLVKWTLCKVPKNREIFLLFNWLRIAKITVILLN